MPKLKPATQAARRENILDAAERCFAASGFHGTSMQDICKSAGVSSGALYLYFSSKEALIAGIAERDRAKLHAQLGEIAKAPDLLEALKRLCEHYLIDEPRHKVVLMVEIGAEASRNPAVGGIVCSVDRFVQDSFSQLFARARAEGRIRPVHDDATLARIVLLIGDGMFWRRAVDPDMDARTLITAVMSVIATLLDPAEPSALKHVDSIEQPQPGCTPKAGKKRS